MGRQDLPVRIRGTRGQARGGSRRGGTAPGPQPPQRGAHRSSRGAPAKAQAARRDVRAGGADVQAERRIPAAQIRELAVRETPRRRGARADDAVGPLAVEPPAQHAHRLNEQLDAEPATPPEAPAAVREVLLVSHAARVGVALRQRPEEPLGRRTEAAQDLPEPEPVFVSIYLRERR